MTTQEFQYQQIQALQKRCTELQDKIDQVAELIDRSKLYKPRTREQSSDLLTDIFYSWKEIYSEDS
mgnify:FL=1|jgi:hypothetical protein